MTEERRVWYMKHHEGWPVVVTIDADASEIKGENLGALILEALRAAHDRRV